MSYTHKVPSAIHVRPTNAHLFWEVFKLVNIMEPPVGTRLGESEMVNLIAGDVNIVIEEREHNA